MKILIGALLVLLAVAAQPASAQWRNHGGGRQADSGRHYFEVQSQRQRPGGYERGQPPRDFQRGQPPRDFRQPERREFRQYDRDYRQPERIDRRAEGRLTDEERHNLRRDLDRANREIYKGR